MVKTIKVIHLAPGESILITAAPAPTSPCQAAGSCTYTCGEHKQSDTDQPPKEIVALIRVA